MKQFNKNIEEKKIKFKHNKSTYIKRLSISLSCLILVIGIVLFTFAIFESKSNEYTLINGVVSNGGDVVLSYIVDGVSQNEPPAKGTGYKIKNVSCTNADGEWSNSKWGLMVYNLTGKAKCNLEFETLTEVVATLYSAAEDEVYYYEGNEKMVLGTTDADGKLENISIPAGVSLTIYSSVAKDPNNLSDYYSKEIYADDETSSIYVMPAEGVNMLYWYGYKGNCDDLYKYPFTYTNYNNYSTNYMDTNKHSGIIGPEPVTATNVKAIAQLTGGTASEYVYAYPSISGPTGSKVIYDQNTNIHVMSMDTTSYNMSTTYISFCTTYSPTYGTYSNARLFALWAE